MHVIGRGLIVHHLRRTDSCNGEYEELPPIDFNLQYDFNFQEPVHLPELVTVLPVIYSLCIYVTVCRVCVIAFV